jgi:phosphate/sulfate permease
MFQTELKKLSTSPALVPQVQASSLQSTMNSPEFQTHIQNLYDTIDYAPWWVIAMISISLGIGTMFGWKRIVKTLGKKI